jgi:hypothetical protein
MTHLLAMHPGDRRDFDSRTRAVTSFDSPATVEPTWEGMIFTGAVRDTFVARSLPGIFGADATLTSRRKSSPDRRGIRTVGDGSSFR